MTTTTPTETRCEALRARRARRNQMAALAITLAFTVGTWIAYGYTRTGAELTAAFVLTCSACLQVGISAPRRNN